MLAGNLVRRDKSGLNWQCGGKTQGKTLCNKSRYLIRR